MHLRGCVFKAEGEQISYAFDATFTDMQVGKLKLPTTASHLNTATSNAAYTHANTVWHLIYHQSLQVQVSQRLISLLDLALLPIPLH